MKERDEFEADARERRRESEESARRLRTLSERLESEKKELLRKIEETESERGEARDKSVYYEELWVARDAISNLRSSFSDSDPNQHILDTLEQCVSVIVERVVEGEGRGSKPGSRMSEHSDTGGYDAIIVTTLL